MSKWTEGPWTRVPQSRGGDLIALEYATGNQMNPKGFRLIAYMMVLGDSLETDEANARLIAAAPEMAELLKSVIESERFPSSEWYSSARAILAKVNG